MTISDPMDSIQLVQLHFEGIAYPRAVQYVHWVMNKCIMVKVGGEQNTHKICKKQMNFSKTGGEIWQSREGNNNFREIWGEMY